MGQFFAKDYVGEPFHMFGPPHLIAIGIVALINVILICLGRRFPPRWRSPFRYTLAFILISSEALWHWWNWATDQWTIQTMLPLHLCSVLIFLSALMLVTRSYSLYELVYFLGIAGASQALITPDAGRYGFPHFRFFQCIISHGSVVVAGVFMTTVEWFRPFPKSILRVAVIANLYMLFVAIVNAIIGSNYLMIAYKPKAEWPTLFDLLPPWPWYIPVMELIGLVLALLLYLPFARQDWKVKRVTQRGGPN
jgi:hypothetical integral membrane protein (TIGR02206 family)